MQKQLAMNLGDINVDLENSSASWVDNTGNVIATANDATSFVLENVPSVFYKNTSSASVYDYAKGLFSGNNVPNNFSQTMATLASYFVTATGNSVQSVFSDGIMSNDFRTAVNSLREPGSQLGFTNSISNPNWQNNYVLAANMKAINGKK